MRQALNLLVDRASVQEQIYGRTGVATANFVNAPSRFVSKQARRSRTTRSQVTPWSGRATTIGLRLSGSSKKPKESRENKPKRRGAPKPTWPRVLKWVGIAAAGWILLSIVLFALLRRSRARSLMGASTTVLDGNPFLAVSPQTILVLGTDVRPSGLRPPRARPTEPLKRG